MATTLRVQARTKNPAAANDVHRLATSQRRAATAISRFGFGVVVAGVRNTVDDSQTALRRTIELFLYVSQRFSLHSSWLGMPFADM